MKGRLAALAAAVALAAVATLGCGDRRAPASAADPTPRMRYDADGRPTTPIPAAPSRPDVLLICLDTVRADALAPWATGAPRMPETSAWLATVTVFRDAHAPASWTLPSVTSLLTGLAPSDHGARELSDAAEVPRAIPTLAEILSAAGVRCAAFTGGGWVRASNGMLQGFASVGERFSFAAGSPTVLRNYRNMPHDVPNFLFLHTYEAHDPYGAPPASMAASPAPATPHLDAAALAAIDAESARDGGRALALRFLADPTTRADVFESVPGRKRLELVMRWLDRGWRDDPRGAETVAEARKAYDEGLARLDHALAGFLRGMAGTPALDATVIVLCADHGEGFGEHGGVHHGRRLYEELTHVPLAIRAPGLPKGAVVEGTCSLLDVMPTILALEGLPPAEGGGGTSLLPLVRGEPATRVALSEERRSTSAGGASNADLVALRDPRVTWIGTRDRHSLGEEAYDRVADPREERPIPLDEALARASDVLRAAVEARRR